MTQSTFSRRRCAALSTTTAAAALLLSFAMPATATSVSLFEAAFHIDGAVAAIAAAPANVNTSAFDQLTGLGQISITITGAGSHHLGAFVDHEIDETSNTFFNEFGAAVGAAASGQSWEIDEPGFVFGDIYANFTAGTLDNSNAVPAGSPDDVSMALGWNFNLLASETATVRFVVTETAPASGFYLQQTDPDSQASIFFTSALTIRDSGQNIPEPTGLALLALGLAALRVARRRKAPA